MEACWDQVPENRPSFSAITQRLRDMTAQHPMFNFSSSSSITPIGRTEPPTGTAYFVATKIENLFALFDESPRAIQAALQMHNNLVRTQTELFDGYEASCENFEFLLAFHTLEKALNWCISFHTASMNVAWPDELLRSHWGSEVVSSDGKPLWKGPRVHTVVHTGSPICEMNLHSGRMIYSGAVIDRLKRITAGKDLQPGIIITTAVRRDIDAKAAKLSQQLVFNGDAANGAADAVIYASPESLRERVQLAPQTPTALLHSPSDDVLDLETLPSVSNIPPKVKTNWIVKWTDLDVKENIGKGQVGDYYRAFLKGKEVVVKVLVNQGLKENDLICLVADAAVVSKTSHPNLLEFNAVCIDNSRIRDVFRGSLRQLLANSQIQISFTRKVQVAKQIASAMEYLSSHSDSSFRVFDSLKTNNVLITERWEAKIADYGQSNLKDLARTMTSIASVIWTAPEVLCGEPITVKSPIYAFGILMWEMLTRTVPFEKEHPIKLISKILAGHRPTIPNDCPRNYREIMENCWHNDPEMRPSWHVINSDLEHILHAL